MADYQKMYNILFNEMTDAVEELDRVINEAQKLKERLINVQQMCEEVYIEADDTPLKMRLKKPLKENVGE